MNPHINLKDLERILPAQELGTKAELIKQATDLFYKKGYASTSIREIGKKTGVASSNIYYYFNTKEDILFEILYNTADCFLSAYRIIEEKISEPHIVYKNLLQIHIQLLSQNLRKEAKIWTHEYNKLSQEHYELFKIKVKDILEINRKYLGKATEKGLINEIDPSVILYGINGIMVSFVHWFRDDGRLSRDELADQILRFITSGILKEPANLK
jgi:AcrR family transcriptional regulator